MSAIRYLFLLTLPLIPGSPEITEPAAIESESVGMTASVGGFVYDSVAGAALGGAVVQLEGIDVASGFNASAVSDSTGRYALPAVPDGMYRIGFFHPVLDSLGLEPTLREVKVDGGRPVRVDLAVPSVARLRAAVCGSAIGSERGGFIIGFVRNARDDEPVGGVNVTGEWMEISFGKDGRVSRVPRLVASTGSNGWFAMCNVPKGGTIALSAGAGGDSTGFIEMQVPESGFLRRDLFLGPATSAGSTPANLDGTPKMTNNGRLSGRVVAAATGRPVSGAQVGISGGPQIIADALGSWTMSNAPIGTRMLEVRALGFYPVRQPVDILATADTVRVAMVTFKSVLDTVKIRASRLDPDLAGFEERRRSGFGKFLTARDIAVRSPTFASDIFRSIAGVRKFGDSITVRGAFGDCSPALYINGSYQFT
ncbi:MAG: carboxypeptidase-like regulatory domain-containing protein, partial [Gemmatimonadaceae bacterium]